MISTVFLKFIICQKQEQSLFPCRLTQTGKSSFSCWFAFFHFAVMVLKKISTPQSIFCKAKSLKQIQQLLLSKMLKKMKFVLEVAFVSYNWSV